MSFVGLVPSEHSSGAKRKQGSITKAGNDHARRLLVEAAWNHRRRPGASYAIQRRRRDQQPLAVARAHARRAATPQALDAAAQPRQRRAHDRRRDRPRAGRLRLGDRHRPTTPTGLDTPRYRLWPAAGRPPRSTLASSMRRPKATRVFRQRQPRRFPVLRYPTRACQSDPPSLSPPAADQNPPQPLTSNSMSEPR